MPNTKIIHKKSLTLINKSIKFTYIIIRHFPGNIKPPGHIFTIMHIGKNTSSMSPSLQIVPYRAPITSLTVYSEVPTPMNISQGTVTKPEISKVSSVPTVKQTWEYFKTLAKDTVPNAGGSKLNSVPPASTVLSTKAVLEKAVTAGIVIYDDVKEVPKVGAGEAKLSKEGYVVYKELFKEALPNLQTFILPENAVLRAGMLNIDPSAIIPAARQTHVVIVQDISYKDPYKLLGYLTSQKKFGVELSKAQPISGNIDKAQYFKAFDVILFVEKKDFIEFPIATTYIALPEIKQKLVDYFDIKGIPEKEKLYQTTGITTQHLIELIESKNKKQIVQTNELAKKNLNQEEKIHKNMLKNK